MLPSNYERILKDEIWGVFRHIGIPIETVMAMPIQDRRYFIQKHNMEQEGIKDSARGNTQGNVYNGDLNAFAKTEQSNAKVRGGQF